MKKGGACPVSCVKKKDVRERPNSVLVHLVLFSVQVCVTGLESDVREHRSRAQIAPTFVVGCDCRVWCVSHPQREVHSLRNKLPCRG